MRKQHHIRAGLALCISVLAGILSMGLFGCATNVQVDKQVERTEGEALNLKGKEYQTIAEGEHMVLSVNPSTANIRWEDRETGEYYETRLIDDGFKSTNTRSDLIATYYSGTASEKYASYSSMNTYEYAVETDGVTYEIIDNGIRIVYDIGTETITYKNFPKYISEERLEELVLQYLDDKGRKNVEKQFRLTNSGFYARVTNADNPLAGMAAKQLYGYFYETGAYSYEELEADCIEWDTLDELPENLMIGISVEYALDGDDLTVRIPTNEISIPADYPLKSLSVLPYFLSTKETEDGYLFVPDGSGALIYLDNNKLRESMFTSSYYGGDKLYNAETYNSSKTSMSVPVYGMKTGDRAVLGIIEKGAEIATLDTYLNGYYSTEAVTRASLTFNIRQAQSLASYTSSTSPYTSRDVSTDYYADDIALRYIYLRDDEADYSGMAMAYRSYLLDNGGLAQNAPEEEAPLYIELLGAIDKEKYVLGIPYQGTEILTTFIEAGEILSDLYDKGVRRMFVDYDGIFNGGMNQRAINNVKVINSLGGTSGLKALEAIAQENGAVLFPNVSLQTVSGRRGISKNNLSFQLNGTLAQLFDFNIVTRTVKSNNRYPTYLISPTYVADYVEAFEKSYRKLGLSGLASDDLMTFLASNYKKGANVSQTTGIPAYESALDVFDDYTLMLSDPIVLAYDSVQYITDLPVSNSGWKVMDASVPFLQLVLNGSVNYSMPKLNSDTKDLETRVMKAIETGSALKFILMQAETSSLEETEADDVFMAEYESWKDVIAGYYMEYSAFYENVKGASMISHQILDRAGDLVKVMYSNDVVVYLNYTDEEAVIDGIKVPATSYVTQVKGG